MRADELFVFLGAGASRPMPAALPLFDELRDGIIEDLGLGRYLREDGKAGGEIIEARHGLAPEPFFLSLHRGDVDIVGWLRRVLTAPEPNAVHAAAALLAGDGARVWTVNFDELVERAAPAPLRVAAWPAEPTEAAVLLKPHGTLSGELIVTAEQVLAGLEPGWRRRLTDDVRGRTAVFLGYSGRDLDFQPIWNEVLVGAAEVLWFDWTDEDDRRRKERILPTVHRTGRLTFPCDDPGRSDNPSRAFLDWAVEVGALAAAPSGASVVTDMPVPRPLPALAGDKDLAGIEVLTVLADYRATRNRLLRRAVRGPQRAASTRRLGNLVLNHGGRGVATALRAATILANVGPLARVHDAAQRKRATVLFNLGRHEQVLEATSDVTGTSTSTLLILRAGSLRATSSLDEAVTIGAEAIERALREQHPVRVAHAAFQTTLALIWAGRDDEAAEWLHQRMEPYGALATGRWLSWSHFLAGCLALHQTSPRHDRAAMAKDRFDIAEIGFRAEGLADGAIDAMLGRLVALRLDGDDDEFGEIRAVVGSAIQGRASTGRYYAEGHPFTSQVLAIEDAEFAWHHLGDRQAADEIYRRVAESRYPLHATIARVQLAVLHADEPEGPRWQRDALTTATGYGARSLADRARRALQLDDLERELFFP